MKWQTVKEEISKVMISGYLGSPVGCWNTAGHSCSLVPVEGSIRAHMDSWSLTECGGQVSPVQEVSAQSVSQDVLAWRGNGK